MCMYNIYIYDIYEYVSECIDDVFGYIDVYVLVCACMFAKEEKMAKYGMCISVCMNTVSICICMYNISICLYHLYILVYTIPCRV